LQKTSKIGNAKLDRRALDTAHQEGGSTDGRMSLPDCTMYSPMDWLLQQEVIEYGQTNHTITKPLSFSKELSTANPVESAVSYITASKKINSKNSKIQSWIAYFESLNLLNLLNLLILNYRPTLTFPVSIFTPSWMT
jgi:hypothetical protein